jgi:hypothetical protein
MKINIKSKPKLTYLKEVFEIPIEFEGTEFTFVYCEDDNGAYYSLYQGGGEEVEDEHKELFDKLKDFEFDWYGYCKNPNDFEINYGVTDFDLDDDE